MMMQNEMAGRNDQAIANAMTAVAQALNNALQGQQNQNGGADEQRLDRFMRNNPPTFKGRYDPEGAQVWLQGIERIFRAMVTTDEQKVRLATHMLAEEAEYWWTNTRQRMEAVGAGITWEVFRREFLDKYFPADVRNKKEIEFLELKQGNMSVADYAAKFEELSRFCPHYNVVGAEASKCVKFESGLRPEIKQFIGYQEIRVFSVLVNRCRIYDEDSRARSTYYKNISDKKSKGQDRGKPYMASADKGKEEVTGGSKQSGGEERCFKCGGTGHRFADCKNPTLTCFQCGRTGHRANECNNKEVICYSCGESGHISTKCPNPKKVKSNGKVFALSGEESSEPVNLIQGNFRGRKFFKWGRVVTPQFLNINLLILLLYNTSNINITRNCLFNVFNICCRIVGI
jgi:hypothetical protein